ncbi:MAG: hypothetical protein V4683_00250 [Bacteroidota bacterium]
MAQSAFLPLNADSYHTLDRFEILSGRLFPTIFTGIKPYTRKSIAEIIEKIDTTFDKKQLSKRDLFNIQHLKNDNWEWLKSDTTRSTFSKKKLFNVFFNRKADLYSVDNEDINLHISPIFQFSFGKEGDLTSWQNTRGIEIRGSISKKIGFYTMFTENQIVLPSYIQEYQIKNRVIPGEGHWKPFGAKGIDYISARGYITFSPVKPLMLTFGHDKTFVGSGLRSTILSDFSAPTLFLKVNTQIGRVQYQNQFTQLSDYQNYIGKNTIIPRKYMVSHNLGINIGKNFNLGLFETVILNREKTIDFNYVNPIIFYRFVESYVGSPDNTMVGINFKYISKKKVSIYGQFLFDELVVKNLIKNSGSFTNKWAYQFGAKAINLFGIKNLDLQTEINAARPYTYAHFSTSSNFSNYNQALAHPLGANFTESATVLRYQVTNKLLFVGTYINSYFGMDRPEQNWGGNILLNYDTRVRDEDNYIGQGLQSTLNFMELRLSHMIIHNMYADGSLILRTVKSNKENIQSTIPTVGIRWNIPYKQTAF